MSQKGIALVQVLLFSAILSIISLYFSSLSKEQVAVAYAANSKTEAFVELHSARQRLLFDLLITEKTLVTSSSQPYGWNFFGERFDLNEHAEAQLFDLSSKLNIRYPERARLRKLLKYLENSEEQANTWIANLLDYQDIDKVTNLGSDEHIFSGTNNRNGPISDKSELMSMGLNNVTLEALLENVTIYRAYEFNPINASPALLEALYGSQIKERVLTLRRKESLTKAEFIAETNIKEEDGVFIFPSNDLDMIITSKVNDVSISQKWTVRLRPYATLNTSPVSVLIVNEQ
ncbi:type II secretion system protein GspK [Pseudoalteromonas sp. MMG012]|uniref:type II secretion system protein GspK n=1 Tax=Pseudoalteromonas sp. MMG012 TaxID=2822686 RepID=UPI001B3A1FCA|nr:type II secretion system protein GspK [Pseudoalteromonas sp. MMG012]MBQ4849239.1 general secretion pathway protein GspK [Pseudoalteromonas sp. MMG012]